MKLALISDFAGLGILNSMRLTYHLVLAQYLLEDTQYAEFYKERSRRGDFIMMDNGAAEGSLLTSKQLYDAMQMLHVDEVVLPDVLRDAEATIEKTMDRDVLEIIPARMRAVVPQGETFEEWTGCANFFVSNMEFATMCIPKHTEQFGDGRVNILTFIQQMGWHNSYNIHLLGVWGEPRIEVPALKAIAPWVRGIDTAAPFAYAQKGRSIRVKSEHISHVWNEHFDSGLAYDNALSLLAWTSGRQDA